MLSEFFNYLSSESLDCTWASRAMIVWFFRLEKKNLAETMWQFNKNCVKNIPLNFARHHLCSIISFTVIRFFESGSSIFRNSDSANVSSLLHGVIVIQEMSLFHLTNSAQPVVGSSQGNSVNWFKIINVANTSYYVYMINVYYKK